MERAKRERRAAQAKRGSLGRLLAGARGQRPLGGLSTASVRVSAPNFRVGVAGRTQARMDGKRKTPGTMGGCSAGRVRHPSRQSMDMD